MLFNRLSFFAAPIQSLEDSSSPANCLHGRNLDLIKPLGWHYGIRNAERRSKALLTDSQTRVESFRSPAVSIKPKFRPFVSLSNPPLYSHSPGLLAANRHLPRPPRDADEESKGSAPLAKDDTDDTRLLRRGAAAVAAVVGEEALANVALPPLVLAWPPRAATPPELREAQVVVVARIFEFEQGRAKAAERVSSLLSSLSFLVRQKERRSTRYIL